MELNDFALARAIHVLAVLLWIGGVAFVTTTLLPACRALAEPDQRIALFADFRLFQFGTKVDGSEPLAFRFEFFKPRFHRGKLGQIFSVRHLCHGERFVRLTLEFLVDTLLDLAAAFACRADTFLRPCAFLPCFRERNNRVPGALVGFRQLVFGFRKHVRCLLAVAFCLFDLV